MSRFEPNPGQRRARIALAGLVCVLCMLVAPSTSWASGAPMCNELAQSIEAPPTIWPFQGGTLDAVVECPAMQATHSSTLPERAHAAASAGPREAPLSMAALSDAPPQSQRLAIPSDASATHRPGYAEAIYRPPKSEASPH